MFLKIELIDYVNNSKDYRYTVYDTEFEKEVVASDLLDAFRKVYENTDANIPANLALFIRWWDNLYSGVMNRHEHSPWKHFFALHEKETAKYLMLI